MECSILTAVSPLLLFTKSEQIANKGPELKQHDSKTVSRNFKILSAIQRIITEDGFPNAVKIGGEPFVLLFDSITFGTPAGKKEIEV